MDELEKVKKERDEHLEFAMEANDILRNLWNMDALGEYKERVAKLLEIPVSQKHV